MTSPSAPDERPLLVIIPAYNEADALPGVLAELFAGLARTGTPAHVLVVDDGSEDETARVARRGGAIVLRLPYNLGIGGALRTGFRYAWSNGYRRAIQFDADGQHDPDEIGALLEQLDAGANLVVGSRFADQTSDYDAGRVRRRAMRLMGLTVRLLTGRAFTDTSSGFRGFDAAALELFAGHYPVDYMESVEALMMACSSGLTVVEVPTQMRSRQVGLPRTRRFRLVYHYLRLLFVMFVTASRRRPVQKAPA